MKSLFQTSFILISLSVNLFGRIDFPISSQGLFDPSPDLPSNELTLQNWRVLTRTDAGNGLEDITVAPSVHNSNIGQFTKVTITLMNQPEGIEVLDEVSELGSAESTPFRKLFYPVETIE